MNETLQARFEQIGETIENVEDAVTTMQQSTSSMENHVHSGLRPDLRDLKLFISELNEKADLRLKRLYRAMAMLALINVATLLLLAFK